MNINNIKIISGFKFAEISDVVFSGVFLKKQINTLDLKDNIQEHIGDDEYVFVKKKILNINENDIIFCKTEYIKELFYLLNKCDLKNIKLITHQSDLKINKKMFMLKPKCISKWYSINVDYDDSRLIPIPIGIANFHSKNLNESNFKELRSNNYFSNKNKLLYLNFNPNTNFSERKGLYSLFDKKWSTLQVGTVSHNKYQKDISDHKFILSPWGNGIDTHRFWESLYSGSIPITKNHSYYSQFTSIPKVLVDNYEEINEEFLHNKFKEMSNNKKTFNNKELDFSYWEKIIRDESENLAIKENVVIKNYFSTYFRFIADVKHRIYSKLKIFNRLRRYIYKKFKI